MKLKSSTIATIRQLLQIDPDQNEAAKKIASASRISLEKAKEKIAQAIMEDKELQNSVNDYYSVVNSHAEKENSIEAITAAIQFEEKSNKDKLVPAAEWNALVKRAAIADNIEKHVLTICESTIGSKQPLPRTLLVNPQTLTKTKKGRCIIVNCFDWHMGAQCRAEESRNGREWNVELCHKAIDDYAKKIIEIILEDNVGFEKIIINWGGDLYHTFTGMTAKGTILETEIKGPLQFKEIYAAMVRFTETLLQFTDTIENYYVKGNHGGHFDFGLGFSVAQHFVNFTEENREKNNGKVCTWEVSMNEMLDYEVNGHLIMLHHGASADSKFSFAANQKNSVHLVCEKVTNSVQKRTNKIYKEKHIFVGDKHHSQHLQFSSDIYFHQSGALTSADLYAQNMNLISRPSQVVCKFDENGLKCVYDIPL